MPGIRDTDGEVIRSFRQAIQSKHRQTATATSAIVDTADVSDAVRLREAHHDFENAREHVQMLMAVEVRDAKAAGQHLLDLRPELGLDIPARRKKKTDVVLRHDLAGRERTL